MQDLNFYEAFNELEQINEDSDKARLARETFWKDYAEYRRAQKEAEEQAKLDAENKQYELANKKEANVTSLIPTEVLAEYKDVVGKDPQAAIKQYLSQPYISVIRHGKVTDILPSRDSVENIAYAIKSNMQDDIKDAREQAAIKDSHRVSLTDPTKSDEEQRQDIYNYFNKDGGLDFIKRFFKKAEIKIERDAKTNEWYFCCMLDPRLSSISISTMKCSVQLSHAINSFNESCYNCENKFTVKVCEGFIRKIVEGIQHEFIDA